MAPKRRLLVDESEEEGDYIEVSERRNDVEEEEEDEEPLEVDFDDEIEDEDPQEEAEEEEEDKDVKEKEDDDLEEEEEEDNLEEEEEDECLQEEEEEDKDLEKKEDHDEDGSSNPYYFGKKSPKLSDNDEIKNHESYRFSYNPNENQHNQTTTTIKPNMPTSKPTILSKRAAENTKYLEETRSKIRKVLDDSKREKIGEKVSGKKFPGSCRLWSEDDEIRLLKGMIDYHSEKGVDAYANMGAFHKFIIKLLHIDVSKDQLMRKIRRLKNKYQNNKMVNGKDPVFLHEQKSFKLSKKIWGVEDDDDVDDDDDVLDKGEASKAKDKAGQEKFWSLYPCLSQSLHLEQFSKYSLPHCGMSFVKERLSSIGSAKAKEFEDKWRQLYVAETRVNMKRAKLILEQTKLILNAIEL